MIHTGSHPVTEYTCDDMQCWCNGGAESNMSASQAWGGQLWTQQFPQILRCECHDCTQARIPEAFQSMLLPRQFNKVVDERTTAAVLAERERCAKVAEDYAKLIPAMYSLNEDEMRSSTDTCEEIAAKIREGK